MVSKRIIYLFLFFGLPFQMLKGQHLPSVVSSDLENLFGRLLTVNEDSVRIRVNDSILTIVDSYVKSDTIFTHRFNNVRFMGQIISPDSLIKIVTWNLYLRNQPGRYYLYIVRKLPETNSRKVYRLFAEYNSSAILADTIYKSVNWYGALYYDIRPQIINGKSCWVLLGIDYGNFNITRKIIEILSFNRDDTILFGLKSFISEDAILYRVVFEYSATATMTLRFDGDDSVIYDHLVPFSPELVNDRQYYGPHYSNDAYVLENDFWKFKLNVDARNIENTKQQFR
ncbi:MAG TPA: hypothetical protein VMV47_16035 [Bacteroidales bacterium]|nr:hypothetical protein [Bacteroidales bacterium]